MDYQGSNFDPKIVKFNSAFVRLVVTDVYRDVVKSWFLSRLFLKLKLKKKKNNKQPCQLKLPVTRVK